jgi:hypothetical protein
MLLLGIMPLTMKAQSTGGLKKSTPEQRAQMQTDYLKTNLSLDDAQTEKIAAINLKYAQKMEPVIKGGGARFSKMRAAKNINEQKEAEYKEVLTDEQYKKYQQVKEDMKEKAKEKMKERQAQAG